MQQTDLGIHLIAWTHFEPPPAEAIGGWDTDADGGQALVEFAGRACYQSWDKPNPATATNGGYVAHLLEVGHLSVLEHGTATFYLTGVSRSFTHELIRHRHFSYSQLSQRYVPDEGGLVIPEAIASDLYLLGRFNEAAKAAAEAYRDIAHALERKHTEHLWAVCADPGTCTRSEHWPDPTGSGMRHRISDDHPRMRQQKTAARKAARQAARAVLPNATETRIVVTGNYRAWRHFITMRATEHADVEIRQVAIGVLELLARHAPNVFGDFETYQLADGSLAAFSRHQKEC